MTELVDRAEPLGDALERHRIELTGFCYRMLGSAFEAEDAVQDTFVRAWRAYEKFEGRSSLRSWLYRIATNVCFDLLDGRSRRARPIDLGPAQTIGATLGAPLADERWLQPVPDARVIPEARDPAEVAELRDSVRLAFVAALQHLPPRQRAVLILREVLQWPASDVAEQLGTTVASVNSALQRARATLADKAPSDDSPADPLDAEHEALLADYVDAFERYDMDSLTALLQKDAAWSMPPYELWLRGHDAIRWWCLGPGVACRGSRLVPVQANGSPGFGHYKPDPERGGRMAWSLQVLDVRDGEIAGITFFLDTARFFPLFGLPLHLPPSPSPQITS